MSEQEVLELIHTRLSKVFEVQKLILFGSRAKGTAHSSSDFDILVVAESDIPFVKRQGIARMALGQRDFPIDLLVYTPSEAVEEGAITGTTVYFAQSEGREFRAQA